MSAARVTMGGIGERGPWTFHACEDTVYVACPGAPIQPGRTCDRCGQGIQTTVWFVNEAGERIGVGLDCAARVNITPEEIAKARSEMLRMAREARWSEATRERHAIEAERARVRAEVAAANAPMLAPFVWLRDNCASFTFAHRWARDVVDACEKGLASIGDDERTFCSVLTAEAERAKSIPASTHFGATGERFEAEVTFLAIFAFQGFYGVTRIIKLRDDAGRVLVWKTSSYLDGVDVGARIRIKGTVKGHGEYRGDAQTDVVRVKVLSVLVPEPTDDWKRVNMHASEVR